MNRSLHRITFALGAAALAQSLAGCAGQGDIDRSQPDKIAKSMFFAADGKTPKVFYYRQTYVDVPITSSWAFEGTMGNLDKVRFDIQQNYLYGYRSYDYIPNASSPLQSGSQNQDTPLVVFKILSHFDVKREYNAGTGEQTNVISENTTDRPWYDRDYMRVDWSVNLVDIEPPGMSPSGFFMPTVRAPVLDYDSQSGAADPDHPIWTPSYFDFTIREIRTPDADACFALFHPGIDDGAVGDCGPAQLKVRYSFLEAKPSTYLPLSYPDRQPLLDDNNKPIRLQNGTFPCTKQVVAQTGGTDCSSAAMDEFAKFGFFRTVRQTYDRNYGATEQGRQYLANRWNIWKDGAKAMAAQPDRTTREIAYYTNPEFPEDPDLFSTAQEIVGSWNGAMKQTVSSLNLTQQQPTGIIPLSNVQQAATSLKDIFVLKKNSCNLQNVKDHAGMYKDLADAVENATGDSVDNLTVDNLRTACAAMELATQNLADDDAKKFTWQRNGDLRYSFLHWVDHPQASGPLGFGPSSADPETGEIISAGAYIYGAALNTYAQFATDTVQLLNHSISTDDLISGKTITDVMAQTAAQRQARQALPLTDEAKAMSQAMLSRTAGGQGRLVTMPPGALDQKFDAIKGTAVEQQMMTTDILNIFGAYEPNLATDNPDLYARVMDRARPANLFSERARATRASRFQTLANNPNGCLYMEEFADDAILGTALKMANLPADEIYKQLRVAIFRGVAEHEVGHTMGLRHNFSGSSDALNYFDNYWNIRGSLPQDQWAANQLMEYQYSTVMDYGARFNTDVHGLGKYDYAAIRFGYGQIVDTISQSSEPGSFLASDVFFGDYNTIPAMVGGVENISNGATGVARYQAVSDFTRAGYLDPTFTGGILATPERPYKYCSDEFIGNIDCKPWDEGASQAEIIDNTIDQFKNYYYFDAFMRNRVTWNIGAYLNRISDRYFARYTEAFQFYYFFGNAFLGSFLSDDLQRASIDALNSLGEILQTPEPGLHCATPENPNLLVLPDPSGPNSCVNGTGLQVDFGVGKPYFVAFSPDYYYRITRAGSLYEKLAALQALTTTQSRFFRVDTFADANQYSINYYRIFKDQMLNLISGVIRNDPLTYGGYDNNGVFTATPVVDLNTYGKATYPPPMYMQSTTPRVDTPVNKTIQYWALGFILANLDSTWDYTLDVSNYLAVTVKGAIDDVTYDPGIMVKEFTHPQSGQVYRAPVLDPTRAAVGTQVIDELNAIAGTKGVTGTIDLKFGAADAQGTPLPDWQTARANLDAAQTSGDQTKFQNAQSIFQYVDYLLGYRVDLLNDLRNFRRAFGY
jgi:hypothetical protein